MRSTRGLSIGSPGVLIVLAPLISVTAAGAALLLGLPVWAAGLCALLVPWALAAVAGLGLVLAAARPQPTGTAQAPAPRRADAIDLRGRQIDLRDESLDRRLPRSRSEPVLDPPRQETGKRGSGAP